MVIPLPFSSLHVANRLQIIPAGPAPNEDMVMKHSLAGLGPSSATNLLYGFR